MSEEIKPETEPQGETDAADTNDNEVAEQKERDELNAYIADLNAKIEQKTKMRNENLNCVRPGDDYFSKLDSSLKKNTAFVKKLKQFTAPQLDSLSKDMSTLNLTKYISEVSSALSEAKIKLTDVNAAVAFCSELHKRYSYFVIGLPTILGLTMFPFVLASFESVLNRSVFPQRVVFLQSIIFTLATVCTQRVLTHFTNEST